MWGCEAGSGGEGDVWGHGSNHEPWLPQSSSNHLLLLHTVSVNRKWTVLLDLGVGLCCWALVYAYTHFLIVPHARRTLGRVDSLLS